MASNKSKSKKAAKAAHDVKRAAIPAANLARPGLELWKDPRTHRLFPYRDVRVVAPMRQLKSRRIRVREGTPVLHYLLRLRVDDDVRHAGHLVAMNALAEIELAARLMDPSRIPPARPPLLLPSGAKRKPPKVAEISVSARAFYTDPSVVAFGLDRAPRVLYELSIDGGGFEEHFVDELAPKHLRVLVALQELQGDLCAFADLDWPPPSGLSDDVVELLHASCRRAMDRILELAVEFAGFESTLRKELEALDDANRPLTKRDLDRVIAARSELQVPEEPRRRPLKANQEQFVRVLRALPPGHIGLRLKEILAEAKLGLPGSHHYDQLDALEGWQLENGKTIRSNGKGAKPRLWRIE